ncbi:hypothetical protein APHAL10511_008701 [Amanita phalloides]|nr:hypothetical protein APHAL10511_008701 [Amanita phalloides]
MSWSPMPPGIDVNTGAVMFDHGYDEYQARATNGTPYPHYAAHHLPSSAASTPAWASAYLPQWQQAGGGGGGAVQPPAPVTPTPAGSFGLPSPASFGPTTPMSGFIPATPSSYPLTATPSFGAGRMGAGGGGGLGLIGSPMLDVYGYPLTRTPSNGRRKRKTGTRAGAGAGVGGPPGLPAGADADRKDYQLWRVPEQYSLKNLARRPRDWRPDYNPRSRIASYITLGRHRTDVPDYTDPVKRTLNALLQYKPGDLAMYWNLRHAPNVGSIEFLRLNRVYNNIDMVQLATSPPANQMRLYHPRLPWYIDVFSIQPNGITINDILATIYTQLSTQIHQRHYYNEELDDAHRGVLSAAFSDRCKNRREEADRGILQVDFLADKYVLLGLVKGKGGMWEMKTSEED